MEAIGIYIDGAELKIAHLRRSRSQMEILSVQKIHLPETDRRGQVEDEDTTSYAEIMGLAADPCDGIPDTVRTDSPDDILFNTIYQYAVKNLHIGINIPQSEVVFTNIGHITAKNDKDTRLQIREELYKISTDITTDNFGYLRKSNDRYLAFYHNKTLELLHQLTAINETLNYDLKIALVDINEVSMVNLYLNMIAAENEISAFIYIGNEYSRIAFFQGQTLIDFSQLLNAGYHSEDVLRNVYGRIVAEIDTSRFEAIDHIIITGDGNVAAHESFFREQLPGSNIVRLPYDAFFNFPDPSVAEEIDAYAIPVALAWKILEKDRRTFIDTNFLPPAIVREQRRISLAWHGIALLGLMVLAGIYTLVSTVQIQRQIRSHQSEITRLDERIAEVIPVAMAVDSIAANITTLQHRMTLVDSLAPETVRYSDFLKYMASDIDAINSLWLIDLSVSNTQFALTGNSIFGNRIHQLAHTLEQSRINIVNFTKIQDKNILKYQITGGIPNRTEE